MQRTFEACLSRARGATNAAEAERDFTAALSCLTRSWEARALLLEVATHPYASRRSIAETVARTLELAATERDVWAFRDAASVQCDVCGDREAARASLEACARSFHERPEPTSASSAGWDAWGAHGYQWVLLGNGFLELLNDREGLRSCLEAGLGAARARRKADDMSALGVAWHASIDRAEGRRLVEEAERLLNQGDPGKVWTQAVAWHQLNDPDGVRRVLQSALSLTDAVGAALTLFRACASLQEPALAGAAIEVASQRSQNAADWLALAQAVFDTQFDAALVRSALARAEAAAPDAATRERLARAYWLWLKDAEQAARFGPRGARPAQLRAFAHDDAPWESSAEALFDWLRARISSAQIEHIAQADYGQDADKHGAALRDICTTGLVPRELAWVPHEVLALTRWWVGDDVDHVVRAFCSILLCLAPGGLDDLVTNGAILLESCLVLGSEATTRIEPLFAWLAQSHSPSAVPEAQALERCEALLLLLVTRASTRAEPHALTGVADALVDEPSDVLTSLAESMRTSMRADLWRDVLATQLAPLKDQSRSIARLLEIFSF